ncbi:MAG: beta-lactamase family protein [Hyphomicrobiales bacterium]|nr:beta-lactamase family protein [Hyphomicrobiales bacterium]
MRALARIVKWLAGPVVVAVIAAIVWLAAFPPDLLRVGAGYAAKIVCSNVFIAGRDPEEVLAVDVQAPGNPLLKFFYVDVDRKAGTVKAAFLGHFASNEAVVRRGLGCALVPDGNVEEARKFATVEPPQAHISADLWPEGERVEPSPDPMVAKLLGDKNLIGPGMRAVVVVKDGRIVGERYGEGFAADTPLIGWSMSKTVNVAILGTVLGAGKLSLDQKNLFPEWSGDERRNISIADLMAMESGLAFNEDYGTVSDVTRMLYLEPDMAKFAASKPLVAEIGRKFSYSTGASVMLARLWQNAVGDEAASLGYPRLALFNPLGMQSAILEADESGTLTGASYLYATAHDWARFGQFLLQDGVWNGNRILPEGFVEMMHAPAAASDGVYGKGEVWLEGPGDKKGAGVAVGVPEGTYWLEGHDGQTVAIVPSKHMVVVRMGLTPAWLDYRPQKLVVALVKAVE